MRDGPTVVALITRARGGDQGAWYDLIERYSPLVWSICSSYRLSRSDIDDVAQGVWVLLVERLGQIREPAALPGWLATTTHRECLRTMRGTRNHAYTDIGPDAQDTFGVPETLIEEQVIMAERDAALRAAFADLPPGCQRLLALLISDPPVAYAQISAALDMPIGSIGPSRIRCLQRLRRSPHLAAVIDFRISAADEMKTSYTRGGGTPNA